MARRIKSIDWEVVYKTVSGEQTGSVTTNGPSTEADAIRKFEDEIPSAYKDSVIKVISATAVDITYYDN